MTVEQAIEAARWKWQPYTPTEAALVSLADEVERLRESIKGAHIIVNEANRLRDVAEKELADWKTGIAPLKDQFTAGLSSQCAEIDRLTRANKHLVESCKKQAQLYVTAAQRGDRYRDALERVANPGLSSGHHVIQIAREALKE